MKDLFDHRNDHKRLKEEHLLKFVCGHVPKGYYNKQQFYYRLRDVTPFICIVSGIWTHYKNFTPPLTLIEASS